ncbi:MAG: hypothetical protein M5R40_07340 [Anaerolineae bacterium]|nr:hypothetical protein [Anaerolineae bacterium]
MGRIIRLGTGLALVAAGVIAVLFLAGLTLPPVIDVPVAVADIPTGTVIDRSQFRIEQMRGLSGQVQGAFVDKVEFLTQYEGGIVADGETVYEGFPLSPRQVVFSDAINGAVDRLTLLTDPAHVVFPIDVKPGQVGNYVRIGDYVDLVFTVGRVEANQIEVPPEPTFVPDLHAVGTPQPPLARATPVAMPPVAAAGASAVAAATLTPTPATLDLPLAVIALPDVLVLRSSAKASCQLRRRRAGPGRGDFQPAGVPGRRRGAHLRGTGARRRHDCRVSAGIGERRRPVAPAGAQSAALRPDLD